MRHLNYLRIQGQCVGEENSIGYLAVCVTDEVCLQLNYNHPLAIARRDDVRAS